MGKKESLRLLKFEHAWKTGMIDIEKTQLGEGIISPSFHVGNSGDFQARFMLFPRGVVLPGGSEPEPEYASLYLHFESKIPEEVNVRVKFSMLSLGTCQELARCQCVGTFVRGKSFGLAKFVRRDLMKDGSKDECCRKGLVILCTIHLLVSDEHAEPGSTVPYTVKPDDQDDEPGSVDAKVTEDASKSDSSEWKIVEADNGNKQSLVDEEHQKIVVFKDDCYGDLQRAAELDYVMIKLADRYQSPETVLVICRGLKFYVDKNILASHSSIIAFMLMTMKSSNTLELNGLEPEVLRELLKFMYTGTINNWEVSTVRGLLEAANQYEIKKLKDFCEDKLFKLMNHDNVFDVLVVADQYKIGRLKRQALEIIVLHAKWLVKTPGFRFFMWSDKTQLIFETFQALALANAC